jgi:hypothetical protein
MPSTDFSNSVPHALKKIRNVDRAVSFLLYLLPRIVKRAFYHGGLACSWLPFQPQEPMMCWQ